MAHRNPVADRYRVKFERRPACLTDSTFNNLCDFVQMNMARHYLAEAVGNADKGLVNIVVTKTAGMKQAPVRSPLEAFLDRIASHSICLSSKMAYKVNLKAQKADFNA